MGGKLHSEHLGELRGGAERAAAALHVGKQPLQLRAHGILYVMMWGKKNKEARW